MIIENPMPMCIFWGSDFIQLYNDSYAEILGDAHPVNAFGKGAKET